ncbi:Xaa-Pro aminopeptidase [Hydrogenoanaerobacterium saccharovorans]|uniref:Xaa-Pro aminopeptidase n=1 Tax=Hydrogenoanaerobacterium saccharovorans TaxID=474960 RepID=A0A1H7ZQD5_9FIRM|nr:aminopeptidase P family protein [Hydrogenoanaerobacterium saccharovorans]RPF48460.1 Xaa-Pro aminopeptidase [Hydrogenoanaerobacterium saccharovorans]SEM60496.1 Xaa-Pro aminopeptidase [Hydrogenoanaerobacterium saccharovorans]
MKSKIQQLMQNLPEHIDAALITSEQNRRYYTGFPSSAGILFVTKEAAYFLIDFRYVEAAKTAIKDCEVLLLENTQKSLQSLCKKHAVKTVAAENSYLTVGSFHRFSTLLSPVKLLDEDTVDQLILSQRRYKTIDEIEKIRTAQALTEETFNYILTRLSAGKTEREIALDMEFYMRRQGAEAVSFDFIVVSGCNSSRPHGVPSDKVIQNGDFVTMDFGAIVDGYHSDMTRTVAVGNITDKQKLVYDTVLKAQLAGIDAIKVGASCKDVDAAARDIIYNAGFEGCFGHGLGHSVGVEIHEEPRFSITSDDTVESGIVMTVEPGIYIEGEFGCRIEDMIYVTENKIENLTHSPKNLIIL